MAARRFSESDVFNLYRTAFRIKIDWENILEENVHQFLDVYERSTNCLKNMVIPTLFALTSSMCGPKTRVKSSAGFSTVLNSYIFSVCDPGGGKSLTYERVMEPVLESFHMKTGKRLNMENYTTAGIQNHQVDNKGMGLITSDEGNRFLSSVHAKQLKGESESALLCKMWNGKGDFSNLARGTRGFTETSMSILLLIQPQPLLNELQNFTENDGFLDRFLFFVCKPKMYQSNELRENYAVMETYKIRDFITVFDKMYEVHTKEQLIYTLDEEAQEEYDRVVDGYAEHISNRYNSDDEEDKENVNPTQTENLHMTSSKDTIHILRLAALLHIINMYIGNKLEETETYSTIIRKETVKRAQMLYNCLKQQKSVFVQALMNSTQRLESGRMGKVKPFRNKVLRCVCQYEGPVVPVRDIYRHIKKAVCNDVKIELERLQNEGFGRMHSAVVGKAKRDVFFKEIPSSLGDNSAYIKAAEVSLQEYNQKFQVPPKDDFLKAVLPNHHQFERFEENMII